MKYFFSVEKYEKDEKAFLPHFIWHKYLDGKEVIFKDNKNLGHINEEEYKYFIVHKDWCTKEEDL